MDQIGLGSAHLPTPDASYRQHALRFRKSSPWCRAVLRHSGVYTPSVHACSYLDERQSRLNALFLQRLFPRLPPYLLAPLRFAQLRMLRSILWGPEPPSMVSRIDKEAVPWDRRIAQSPPNLLSPNEASSLPPAL